MRKSTLATVRIYGTIMGLAGIEHGIGEILQGNRPIIQPLFQSWPDSDYFSIMNGEPAFSILPTYSTAGILTILFSVVFILFSIIFSRHKGGWIGLLVTSLAMLLCGAGLFPPVLGIGVALIATRVHVPYRISSDMLTLKIPPFLSRHWKASLITSLAAWFALMPGMNLLSHFSHTDYSTLMMIVVILAIGSFVLVIIASHHRDLWLWKSSRQIGDMGIVLD